MSSDDRSKSAADWSNLLALQVPEKGDEAKFQEFLEKSGQHSMADQRVTDGLLDF